MDEQLRILNDQQISDKKLRALIIKARDESYDAIVSLEKDETTLERDQKHPLYQIGQYATLAVMRLSRKL